MSGLTGFVPYGVDGSVPGVPTAEGEAPALGAGAGWVAALAMGASAIAPPIAAAANHGATWVIFVYMTQASAPGEPVSSLLTPDRSCC